LPPLWRVPHVCPVYRRILVTLPTLLFLFLDLVSLPSRLFFGRRGLLNCQFASTLCGSCATSALEDRIPRSFCTLRGEENQSRSANQWPSDARRAREWLRRFAVDAAIPAHFRLISRLVDGYCGSSARRLRPGGCRDHQELDSEWGRASRAGALRKSSVSVSPVSLSTIDERIS